MLYGMTMMGGTNDMGCIFKIKTDGSGYTKIFDFSGSSNGKYPYGSLTLSGNMLYGMTNQGGNADKGCIFKINASNNAFTKLFDFTGAANGSYPKGNLVLSGNTLYGLTTNGGADDKGSAFSIQTDGTGYTQLLDFSGTENGRLPQGSLIISGDTLYGTTVEGGANDMGCLFSININGTGYKDLLDFNYTNNEGYYPVGSPTLVGTELYGTTSIGGNDGEGSVYKIDPSHSKYSRLINFNGSGNGGDPIGDLIFAGHALFGMTHEGGSYDNGVIFKYVLPPDNQTSKIVFPLAGFNTVNISWTSGDGEKRAVFVKEGAGTITNPDNNTTYTASVDWNAKGSQLGTSGYYCVYNGVGNVASIDNLQSNTTYTVQIFEYNGEAGNEQYLLDTQTGNPNSFQTNTIIAIASVHENPVQIYSDGRNMYSSVSNCKAKAQLTVFELSGRCVFYSDRLEEGLNKIAGDYLPGIYLVRLMLDNRLFTQKVVIK
jgi:uncharacterized repeat protein (TIGR03803 family)